MLLNFLLLVGVFVLGYLWCWWLNVRGLQRTVARLLEDRDRLQRGSAFSFTALGPAVSVLRDEEFEKFWGPR